MKKIKMFLSSFSLIGTTIILSPILSSCVNNYPEQPTITSFWSNINSTSDLNDIIKTANEENSKVLQWLISDNYITADDQISNILVSDISHTTYDKKLKVKIKYHQKSETGQFIQKEINNIQTGINLVWINMDKLIKHFDNNVITAEMLNNFKKGEFKEYLVKLDVGIDNVESIQNIEIKLNDLFDLVETTKSNSSLPNNKFNIKLRLSDNYVAISNYKIQHDLSLNITNVKLNGEDSITHELFNYADSNTKQHIVGLTEFGKTQTNLIIPSTVTTISNLGGSSKITTIDARNAINLKQINENAFANFSQLDTIYLPNSITNFGEGTFKNCVKLTNIYVNNQSVNNLSSLKITNIPISMFENCKKINNLKFSSNIKDIESKAFKDCISLNTLTFGNAAKNDFTNMKWTKINDSVFENTGNFALLKLPKVLQIIGKSAFKNSKIVKFHLDQLTDKSISENNKLKVIDDYAFYQCTNLNMPLLFADGYINHYSPNSVSKKEKINYGLWGSRIQYFGDFSFAYSSLENITMSYPGNNIGDMRYTSKNELVYFGEESFSNTLRGNSSKTSQGYINIHPNWVFHKPNVFKNSSPFIGLGFIGDHLDGYDTDLKFSLHAGYYSKNCFGKMKTIERDDQYADGAVYKWNGAIQFRLANYDSELTLNNEMKKIIELIYPKNEYINGQNCDITIDYRNNNTKPYSAIYKFR